MPATDDTQDPRRSWLNVIPQMHRDGPLSLLCKQRLSPKPVPFTPDDQCKINLIAGGAYEILRKKHRDPKGHFIFEGYGVSQIPEHHFLPALLKKFFPNNLPETFEALNDLQRCVFVLFGSEINHRQNVPAHIGGTIEERSVTNTELKSRASLLEASKEGTATLLDLEKHRNLSMMRELMYLLQAVKTRQAHPESHGYIVIGQHHTERIAQLAESCFGIKPFIFDPINPREGTCGISQKTFTHRYKTPSNDWLNNGCARLKASFLTKYFLNLRD